MLEKLVNLHELLPDVVFDEILSINFIQIDFYDLYTNHEYEYLKNFR